MPIGIQRLFYSEEKTDKFDDIVIAINKKSNRQFLSREGGQEIIEFCSRALNRSESNQVSKCKFSVKFSLFFSLEIDSDFLFPI